MPIIYHSGDCLEHKDPQGRDIIIPHVNNAKCMWGAGFVLSLSRKWKAPEQAYRAKDKHTLGEVDFVQVEDKDGQRTFVCNMIAQEGTKSYDNPVPLNYTALVECLKEIKKSCDPNYQVISAPKFGSDLAGGNWEVIEKIIQEILGDFEVNIYIYKK